MRPNGAISGWARGLIYSGGQSEPSVFPDPQEFILSWTHAISPTGTGIQIFGIEGVTNSSPAPGGGIGLRFRFQGAAGANAIHDSEAVAAADGPALRVGNAARA